MSGYEALRAQVLGTGCTGGTPAGLFVLLGQGMAAWMERLLSFPEPPPTAPTLLVDQRPTALVRVLASMALAAGKDALT